MDIFVKENGMEESLLRNYSDQRNSFEKRGGSKSGQLRRCRSAPASEFNTPTAKQKDQQSAFDYKTILLRRPTVTQAGLILCVYLGVGMICFYNARHEMKGLKTNSMVDALYFCIVTMTTVGYGDLVPNGVAAKLLSCVFFFSGMALVGLLLSGAADYLVQKQEMLLIKAFAKHPNNMSEECSNAQGFCSPQWKLLLSLTILLALIVIGIVVLHMVEGLDLLNSFYCVCSTITTLGYGDHSFSTEGGRIFAIIWILVSTICLAQCFLYLAEARTEDRRQSLVHWVLTRKTTVTDLEAADMDSDGAVSAPEFVIYKLKEMGKIEEEDVALLMKEFDSLDTDHSGRLTKYDLDLAEQQPEN